MRDIKKRIRQAITVSGAALLVAVQVLSFSLALVTPASAESSPEPDGKVKTFIITYDSLPGEPTKANTAAERRAKYRWQKNQVMLDLSSTKGYKKVIRNLSEMPTSIVQADAEG